MLLLQFVDKSDKLQEPAQLDGADAMAKLHLVKTSLSFFPTKMTSCVRVTSSLIEIDKTHR